MRKYIIFRADWREEHLAENRILAHTGAMTDILAEHFDSSERPIPQPGYRLREYHRIEPFVDPKFPGASTHNRVGDWEVTRVEEYTSELPTADAWSYRHLLLPILPCNDTLGTTATNPSFRTIAGSTGVKGGDKNYSIPSQKSLYTEKHISVKITTSEQLLIFLRICSDFLPEKIRRELDVFF
jgi:hypothetical protein